MQCKDESTFIGIFLLVYFHYETPSVCIETTLYESTVNLTTVNVIRYNYYL